MVPMERGISLHNSFVHMITISGHLPMVKSKAQLLGRPSVDTKYVSFNWFITPIARTCGRYIYSIVNGIINSLLTGGAPSQIQTANCQVLKFSVSSCPWLNAQERPQRSHIPIEHGWLVVDKTPHYSQYMEK